MLNALKFGGERYRENERREGGIKRESRVNKDLRVRGREGGRSVSL